MTVAKVGLAMAAMGKPKTKVADLCRELGVTRQTLYRHVSPVGKLALPLRNYDREPWDLKNVAYNHYASSSTRPTTK